MKNDPAHRAVIQEPTPTIAPAALIPVLHKRPLARMPSGSASSEEAAVAITAVAAVIQVAWRATFRKERERSGGKRRWRKSKSAAHGLPENSNAQIDS